MNGDNMGKQIMEMLFLIIIFIGILGGVYWFTRKLGTVNQTLRKHKNMRVIETLPLMQGQYLFIIEVGNEYHLIGSSLKGEITYIKELHKEQIKVEEGEKLSFEVQLQKLMKGKGKEYAKDK